MLAEMSMISLVVTLAIAGVILWAFNTYVTKIDPTIKKIVNVVVIICVVVYLLYAFGVLPASDDIKVPQIR